MNNNTMTINRPQLHKFFHNFLVYFALWAYAALAVLYGIKHIWSVWENGSSYMAFEIIPSLLLIAIGVFTLKVRSDLAAFREAAIIELPGICIAAAVVFLSLHMVENISAEDCYQGCLFKVFLFVCWGIALYRYYSDKRHLFH